MFFYFFFTLFHYLNILCCRYLFCEVTLLLYSTLVSSRCLKCALEVHLPCHLIACFIVFRVRLGFKKCINIC